MSRNLFILVAAFFLGVATAVMLLSPPHSMVHAAAFSQSSPGIRIETSQQVPVALELKIQGEDAPQTVELIINADSVLDVVGNRVISDSLSIDVQPAASNTIEVAVAQPGSMEKAVSAATFTTTPSPTPSPTATPRSTREPAARQLPNGDQFAIGQSASSERIEELMLALRTATLTEDELVLQVAFENPSDESLRFTFINAVRERDLRLIDGEGNGYEAIEVDADWAKVQPQNGFAPGGANIGTITFPIPSGPEPYRLRGIFDFEAIEFSLDSPQTDLGKINVAVGEYPVNVDLFSANEVLAPLYLRVASVAVEESTLTFQIAFVNTGLRPYGLTIGPSGEDAWMVGADGQQFTPIDVSESIVDNITPRDGIEPNGEYQGTITFERPSNMSEVRFIFQQYTPLNIPFDASGQISAGIASSDGNPVATPTPQADVVAFRRIEAMLAAQANAILAKDIGEYLGSIDVELWPEHTIFFDRMTQIPFATIAWEVSPDRSFKNVDDGILDDVTVQMQFTLVGIPEENIFLHDFDLSARQQADGSWQVTSMEPESNPPFWWLGDVAVDESEHFLIFTRPGTADSAELTSELEFAYDVLQNQKLPLEQRYVAYFTAPDESFYELTDASSPRLLGVALSRYQLDKEINVVSRAFYINGSKFVDEAYIGERQITIIHELVHVAFSLDSRPFTPPWLSEGLAVYYSGQESAEERQRLFDEGQMNTVDLMELTGLDSLGEHDYIGAATGYRYIYSGATIRYLVETYGEEQMLAFYRSYTMVPAADVQDRMPLFSSRFTNKAVFKELSEEITKRNVEAFFASTMEELDTAVKDWLIP